VRIFVGERIFVHIIRYRAEYRLHSVATSLYAHKNERLVIVIETILYLCHLDVLHNAKLVVLLSCLEQILLWPCAVFQKSDLPETLQLGVWRGCHLGHMILFCSRMEVYGTLWVTLTVRQADRHAAVGRGSDTYIIGKPEIKHILCLLEVLHTNEEVLRVICFERLTIEVIDNVSLFIGLRNRVLKHGEIVVGNDFQGMRQFFVWDFVADKVIVITASGYTSR